MRIARVENDAPDELIRSSIPTQDILSYYYDKPQFDQDKPIYVDAFDEQRFWTANTARTAIQQLAAGFKAAGLRAGDCVCIHSFNDLNYPVLVNGIAGFGGVYTGSNPAYQFVCHKVSREANIDGSRKFELIHHLKAAEVRFIVVEPDLLTNLVPAADEVGIPRSNILLFDNHGEALRDGFRSWRTLFEHGESDWPKFDNLETAKNTTLARLFSSGTTGLPKAAMLSHYNLIAEHRLFTEWQETDWERRRLVILPMFHVASAPLAHYASLRSGDVCFVARRFDLETYMKLIEKHHITEGAFVPPMVNAIIHSPLSKKYSLKSIRIAHGGAAPLDKWSQNKLQELLAPETPLTQVWGMTETTCTCFLTKYPVRETTGSVGKPLPDMDTKLVDDEGNDITDFDVRGELCVRGPLVFQGYFQNPEANARDFDKDGYFHTGDIAYRDGKSKLWYIVDRKKELIKVRAFQVSPSEIEAVLLKHPKISDAAVIGVPTTNGSGELPRAYIIKKPDVGNDFGESDVKKYIGENLASYKQIGGGVVFVTELPKTPSGKMLKRMLKERAKTEMAEGSRAKL